MFQTIRFLRKFLEFTETFKFEFFKMGAWWYHLMLLRQKISRHCMSASVTGRNSWLICYLPGASLPPFHLPLSPQFHPPPPPNPPPSLVSPACCSNLSHEIPNLLPPPPANPSPPPPPPPSPMDDDDAGGGGDASPQHEAGGGAVVIERGAGAATGPARDAAAASPTSSRSVTETVNGSHRFVIQGYSLAKGMGVGKHIASETFAVGGYQWAIYFYPDGKNPEDNSAYVSVFIALASEGTDVRALFELTLQDQSGRGKHKVHSHFDRALDAGPYTLKYRGSMWGYKRFFRRTALETSDFLKDDCLKINCTVGVVTSTMEYSRPHSLEVPDSDIGHHFGTLLESQEGADVIFSVAGEKFHAHKLVLAARSSFFRSEFLDPESDEENSEVDTSNEIKEIVIDDMEPKVFQAVLHFMYRDNLVGDDELSASSSDCPIFDTLAGKLLAAADKYELPRLRVLCESYLCKQISVKSVATTLALADRHHATELKSVCLKFAAENLSAVIRTDGFDYLKDNCPALQSEILRTVAGCEEECSSGGKSQSVWGQISDGGDTSGRRVRPRV
ncbi:hypothetical protein VPH35_100332 [Triticum aestivum]